MPIRINLLAEAQAAALARRRNPVKRSAWIAGLFVALLLLWMLRLGVEIFFAQDRYHRLRKQSIESASQYFVATNDLLRIKETDGKIAALDLLRTNRFLWGPVFDALQTTTTADVRLIRITGEQTYAKRSPPAPSSRPGNAAAGPSIIEKITLTLEGNDSSLDQRAWARYKANLEGCDYFSNRLDPGGSFILQNILRTRSENSAKTPTNGLFVLVSRFRDFRHGK